MCSTCKTEWFPSGASSVSQQRTKNELYSRMILRTLSVANEIDWLFEGHPMRARGTSCKRRIEIELKPGIEREVSVGNLRHVDDVITFRVDLAGLVLVQEIVRDHQAPFVVSECEVVRTRVGAQVQNLQYLWMAGVRCIKHDDLAGCVH